MSTQNLFPPSGRVALVAGSSRGIGDAIAGGHANAGATVVVDRRHEKTVPAAVAELRAAALRACTNMPKSGRRSDGRIGAKWETASISTR